MNNISEQPYTIEETKELLDLLKTAVMLYSDYPHLARKCFVPELQPANRSAGYRMFFRAEWTSGHFMLGELGIVTDHVDNQPAITEIFCLAHEHGERDKLSTFSGEGVSHGPWWHYLREQVAGLKTCISDAMQEKSIYDKERDDQQEAMLEKKREQYRQRWNIQNRGSILTADNETAPPKF